MAMRPQAKITFAVLGGLLATLILWKTGILAGITHITSTSSSVPHVAALPTVQEAPNAPGGAGTASAVNVSMPGRDAVTTGQPVRWTGYAWNSQMGLMFANGGPVTTSGSYMAQHGIKLTLARKDDNTYLQGQLTSCARELAAGQPDCTSGSHFVSIMGDGAAPFLAGLNTELARLAPDLIAEIVASPGYSRGEDKFMGPAAWRDNPQAARGGLVAGVLRDGDWNIAMFWASNNGICNNPNPETYDPQCLNWVGTADYLTPVEKYNQSACEDRPVVRAGRPTGARQHACVQAVVTWTPGDVNVVHGRGGLVSLLSTRENASQMPNAFIGIRRWNRTHRALLAGLIAAMSQGASAVASNPRALSMASQISDAVYAEPSTGPMYWETYYRGHEERDSTGLSVMLGGSKVNNLADMQVLFGLAPGAPNAFEATYTIFGDLAHQQYPTELPTYPAFRDVSDTSYMVAAATQLASAVGTAERPTFTRQGAAAAHDVARRNWTITFQSGSASFDPTALATLGQLQEQLVVASNMYVDLTGHTDNLGDHDANVALSQRRAQAVQTWLTGQASQAFPAERIRVFGRGPDAPVASNANDAGRAQNRRVEIVLRAAE